MKENQAYYLYLITFPMTITQCSASKKVINQDFLNSIPGKPGVYLMKNEYESVLYVGKAKSLRKRLASYRRPADVYGKITAMLTRVHSIETIITHTEKEALILEASLIKKHKPKYNIILRDDKNYPLIKVTVNERWPRLIMTRRRKKDGARYFGPFSSSSAMWETIKFLNSNFPLRRCRQKNLKKRERPCLNYQIGRCLAPCAGKADSVQYKEMVKNVLMVLNGKKHKLVNELTSKMNTASKELQFEEAAFYRDRINALSKTLEKQVMVSGDFKDLDVFGFAEIEGRAAVSIIFVRNGTVNGQQSFYLSEHIGSSIEIITEVVKRYYGSDKPVPKEILLPERTEEEGLLEEWLSDIRDSRVYIKVPKRGDRVELLRMAGTNAENALADKKKKQKSWNVLSEKLQKKLRLEVLPARIECLDISNISGENAVGSLICFTEGEKDKSEYRHYRIQKTEGPDDYAMMHEVLTRRFSRNSEKDEIRELPDLLLVDGGKGQLNVARKVIMQLGLSNDIELAGIAKEKNEEGEKIYRPNRKNPIVFERHSPVLLFLMRIRDEAHRFGIKFHRHLRSKKTFTSKLDDIPGIGASRRKVLLKELGSIGQIRNSSVDELMNVPGFGRELAEQVWRHFHGH